MEKKGGTETADTLWGVENAVRGSTELKTGLRVMNKLR